MRAVLFDPDFQHTKIIENMLRSAGHRCAALDRTETLLHTLKTDDTDLLLIHWNAGADYLPELAAIRQHSPELPFLLIAGRPPGEAVMSMLAAGPADFLLKPLRRSELLLRVQVLMDRYRPGKLDEDVQVFGPYAFSPATTKLTLDNQAITLTQKEFELALLFFRHLGRPLSRAYIHDTVWSQDAELSSRTLDTHVSRVRSKLGLRPEKGFRLAPVYSFGYRLEQLRP